MARAAAKVRAPLDRERIVSAALRLLSRGGRESLTMPALADELGVSLGAAYHHVASKDELLVLVAQRVFAEIELPDPGDGDWAERLHGLFLSTVVVLRRYPGVEVYALRIPAELRGTTRTARYVVEQLGEAGLDDAGVDVAFTAIWSFFAGLGPLMRAGTSGAASRSAMTAELSSGGVTNPGAGTPDSVVGAVGVLVEGLRALAAATSPTLEPGLHR